MLTSGFLRSFCSHIVIVHVGNMVDEKSSELLIRKTQAHDPYITGREKVKRTTQVIATLNQMNPNNHAPVKESQGHAPSQTNLAEQQHQSTEVDL